MEVLKSWTDGSTTPSNPGNAGSACVLEIPGCGYRLMAQYIGHTTNNVAELTALQLLLGWLIQHKEIREPILIVYTDSQYMQGVCTGKKKAAANKELVNNIRDLISTLRREGVETQIEWVQAHATDELNNLADLLAKYATHYSGIHEKYNGVQTFSREEFSAVKKQLSSVETLRKYKNEPDHPSVRGIVDAPPNTIAGTGSAFSATGTVQPIPNAYVSQVPGVL